jgi:hypothetical protein
MVVMALIFLGCMSLSFGERTEVVRAEDATLLQKGEVTVPPGQAQIVYYPIPYPHPPNLTISDTFGFDHPTVVEQAPDHFLVRNNDHNFARTVTWRAKGVRVPTAIVSPTPAPAAPNLPAEPVPVVPPR